ncbi:MAG: hypothetical protein GY766_01715 [Herbaspirillum sp.]|uniref:hypothetical protein n=1 Tax=Herbaspirillum sp. TaxID=1890675 RepID=UPI0025900AE9|nr:hypothetical protein [Herbaspirillum sp.]MCP3653602.1 hypothetical protein [Herbaspirillum sp.]
MTIKVGDMVTTTKNHRDLTAGKYYKVVIVREGGAEVIDDAGDEHFLDHCQLSATTATILTTITDRMEQHMTAGQYVQAVKWAQVAELVKELEDE